MGFWTRSKDIDRLRKELSDIRLANRQLAANQRALQEVIRNKRRTLSKPLVYSTGNVKGSTSRKDTSHMYEGPVYDLAEIGRAMDVEPYVNQSVRKHREQILKEGWELVGKDEEMVEYVRTRLFEISLVTGLSTDEWIRDFVTNLVTYATTFLVLKRDEKKSGGSKYRLHGKEMRPIAGIFPMDPTSVSVAVNEHGYPVSWKQRVSAVATGGTGERTFHASDVIVATVDRKTGFVFGTPYILPTLDDVRTLRRLEELSEVVCQKHAFPITHWRVGTEEQPAEVFDDGSNEIDLVASQVDNVSAEGGLVTSYRVESKMLGAEGKAIPVEAYMKYFEARVMGGLRLSEIDLGRGTVSKSSGVTVSKSLQDSAKDFQSIVENTLTFYLIMPLLFEGGFDLNPQNVVKFTFPVIDREEERAQQQHGNDLYLGGTIGRDEYRRVYLSKEGLTDEEKKDTHSEDQHEKAKELQAMAEAAAAKKAASSSTAVKNKTKNKTRPTNQSTRKSTKTRVTANNSLEDASDLLFVRVQSRLKDCKGMVESFYGRHGAGVGARGDALDMTTKEEELLGIMDTFVTHVMLDAREELDPLIDMGVICAMGDMEIVGTFDPPKKYRDRFFKNYVEKSFKQSAAVCVKLLNSDNVLAGIDTETQPVFAIQAIFDQIASELVRDCERQADMAYRFGYARALKGHGRKSVVFTPVEDAACEYCHERGEVVASLVGKELPMTSILATHAGCQFDVTPGKA